MAERYPSFRRLRAWNRALLASLWLGGAWIPARADNAAMDYWKAAALMRQPRTPEELETVRRIDEELPDLPPAVFLAWPEMSRWLLSEQPLVNALADAAERRTCDFEVRLSGAPLLRLDHLAMLKAVARRALAVAKAYEYADNREGAAEIYRNLFRMAEHLDADRNTSSLLVGMELVERVVSDLEGFLSRDPPAEAVRVLTTYLSSRRRPFFDLGRCLREGAAPLGRWLLADPARIEERLAYLYGRAASRPGVDRLVTLEAPRKMERLSEWVMEVESHMIRRGQAVNQPYASGLALVRQLDAELRALSTEPLPAGANPLIPLLVPPIERLYESRLLCEAQLDMATILSWAALYRAETGRWPLNLDELRERYGVRLPKDPFTGEDFHYRLVQVRPRLIARVPKWIARKGSLLYVLDVFERRQQDDARATVAGRRAVRQQTAAPVSTEESANAPVPLR